MTLADIREIIYRKRTRADRLVRSTNNDADESALVGVEDALDAADELLTEGRYQDSIRAYGGVRREVWALINGRGGSSWVGAVETPHNIANIAAFMEASCAFMGRIEPQIITASAVDVGLASDDGDLAMLGVHDAAASTAGARRGRSGLDQALAGRYDLAVADFEKAIELADDDGQLGSLQMNLGVALLQLGRTDDAERRFTRAAEHFRGADDALGLAQADQNLAVLRASQGRADDARELFERAEEQGRKSAGGLGNAAEVIAEIDRLTTDTRAVIDLVQPVPTRVSVVGAAGVVATSVSQPFFSRAATLAVPEFLDHAPSATPTSGTLSDLGAGLGLIMRELDDGFHVEALAPEFERHVDREVVAGFLVGSQVTTVDWVGSAGPTSDTLIDRLYRPRIDAAALAELTWTATSTVDTAARLAHIYYFETALGIADAQAGLENWPSARTWYLRAADYEFLNATIEAPLLWHRIASTHLGEGDVAYRDDDRPVALAAYEAVVAADLTAPTTGPLFEHPALAPTGGLVAALLADPEAAPPAALGAGAASTILDIAQRVSQIAAGLDWFGVPAQFVPPFTFQYLQSSARFLAQQAKFAERDYIQFTERFDSATLTKKQLEHTAASAAAERDVVAAQRDAARKEATVAERAHDLANQRVVDAQASRDAFATMSREQVRLETNIAWYSSQNSWELDKKIRGGPDAGRHIHEVVAERRERLGTISREYELLRMDQNTGQLQLGAAQAVAQVDAARARVRAADFAVAASNLRAQQAAELVHAFDAATFTPEVWWRLAFFMRGHARRYLGWATRVARLMERIYEFEHDVQVDRIRTDYSTGQVNGLLGADQLLSDIEYFTFHRLTENPYRPQEVTTEISLAERFPFALTTELRNTGRMTFDLSLADIEAAHPGSFNQRIQDVEVRVIGAVPVGGLHGTLRNSGVSEYRRSDGTAKFRVQDVETLILSAHTRADTVVFRARPEMLGVFEGAGLASTWTIEFPPESNDLDFAFVVDIEVVFHYEAGFDRQLESDLRAAPPPPEATQATTSFSLRWDLPDRFFVLQSAGAAELEIGQEQFPRHHLDPTVRGVSLQLLDEDGPVGAGQALGIGGPGVAEIAVHTDADGRVASDDAALAPLAGITAAGTWPMSLAGTAEERAAVYDIVLFIEYEFTPRGT